jgi:predicted ATPase
MFAVFIGGPNSGKSTAVEMFERDGFPVMHEVAQEVITEGKHKPWLSDEDQLNFQYEVAKRQRLYESVLASYQTLVFLDRGLVDAIAYRLIYGRRLTAFHHTLSAGHYQVAFLMDLVEEWHDNGVRYEDLDFARELTATSRWLYESLGVDVVRVPFKRCREERLDCVRQRLGRFDKPRSRPVYWAASHGAFLREAA